MILLDNKAELQKIQLEIESKQAEKEEYEKKLVQLKNREKKLRRITSNQERKQRTHRLIERGAMLESFIDGASEKTNDEIMAILEEVFEK